MRGDILEMHVRIANPNRVFVLCQIWNVFGDRLNFALPVHEMPRAATKLDTDTESGAGIFSFTAYLV